ncbi:MAG: glycosyltransferase, partial [Minicystis sp.]
LDHLIAPLTGPAPCAAVWAPPVERAVAQTAGDRASIALLGASLHAFPLLAGLDRAGLVGKLFAVRRDVLDDLGGFGALADHLGEDMELARRIRARGGAIEAAPLVARSMAAGRSMEQVVGRFARWLMVIRAQRPWLLPTYPLLFFATPLIVTLALLTAPGAPRIALAAAALALTSRLGVALAAARASGRPVRMRSAPAEALRGDLLLARAFVRALGSRRFSWRGTELFVERGGRLRERA